MISRLTWIGIFGAVAFAGEARYAIDGSLTPAGKARVCLHSTNTPLTRETRTQEAGRFRFKNLPTGTYTLAVFAPNGGMAQRTIDLGPSQADRRRRITVMLQFRNSDFGAADADHAAIGEASLQHQIPRQAMREYERAQKELAKPNVDAAVRRLQKAVDLAPQFAAAWNNLGTIAYSRRNLLLAEECFRKALEADPGAFDPLVNLGGVLLIAHRLDEALECNVHAVATRPDDALAQAQLGMSYFDVGNLDLAVKHLERARQLDPGHFSQPQLTLAEIHLREHDARAAADDMEDFLKRHPDYPSAEKMRETIARLRE